ncbi:hypothetical protein AGMMS50276_33420 [Synergistales bacterium]|nr:hypothetical protein AGMMS50276_33420 [Synergistales bacterium]
MKYKFILFDVDGTLIDSSEALSKSFVKIVKEMTGQDVTPEKYAPYWGVPAEALFRDYGVTDPAKLLYAERKWGLYAKEIREWNPPFPGIEDMLKELVRRGYILGVVTSKTNEALDIDFAPSPLNKLLPNRVTTRFERTGAPQNHQVRADGIPICNFP